MINNSLFSAKKDNWQTPVDFWNWLNDLFIFDEDADNEQPIIGQYFIGKDALKEKWPDGTIYCNPPYGRNIKEWLQKGLKHKRQNPDNLSVFLLAARTDTEWFHEYARHSCIWLLKGRLQFIGAPSAAPFPSLLMIFSNHISTKAGTIFPVDWRNY